MTTNRNTRSSRRPTPFPEDTTAMFHIEFRLDEARERQALLRADREQDWPGYLPGGRSLRLRLGKSLVRLGRRVGGDAMTTPAWLG